MRVYEVVNSDIRLYAPLVEPGGYLVMDDAAAFLPGTFWKGFEGVARACMVLPSMGFTNVLNIGHNCIFCKDRAS